MLTVTENAQTIVKDLTTDAELPEGGGLRLAMAEDQAQLQVTLVAEPQPTDEVAASGEAPVYVAEDTSPALDGQTLDATKTDEGVGFTLQPND